MFIRSLLLLTTGLLFTGPALSGTYSVGPEGDCTTTTLADAMSAAMLNASGPHLIKLTEEVITIPEIILVDPIADFTIEGGYAGCSDPAPVANERTTLHPDASHRHFKIDNSDVNAHVAITFKHLVLENGQGTSPGGGAISATGDLFLMLVDTRVQNNTALFGGGIYLRSDYIPETDRTVLVLAEESEVSNNDATFDGGGIYGFGNARVNLREGYVTHNSAGRNGGGVAVILPSAELIFSPQNQQYVTIGYNTAGSSTTQGYGGGIYSNRANIDGAFAADGSEFRTRIIKNEANYGGGVFIEGASGAGSEFTLARFENAYVVENIANAHGGAFYIRDAVGLRLHSTASASCRSFTITAGFFDSSCSLVAYNRADNENNMPSSPAGGALYVTDSNSDSARSFAEAYRTAFIGNWDPNGNTAVAYASDDNRLYFERSTFQGNKAGSSLGTLIHSSAETSLFYSTVLDNEVTRLFWFYPDADEKFFLSGSILWDPGKDIAYAPSPSVFFHNSCLIAHAAAGLPFNVTVADPQIGADYYPAPTSLAVDDCFDLGHAPIADLYNNAPMDTVGIPNFQGPNDLGAVETDILFYGTFGNGRDF